MNEFELLVHNSYRALLDIGPFIFDSKKVFIDDREKFFPFMFKQLPETVVDKESLRQLQIDDLFDVMNHTRTATGAATLYRSLVQPPTSIDLILAKQEALSELNSNDRLRNTIIEFLEEVKKRGHISFTTDPKLNGEEILYHLLSGRIDMERLETLFPYGYFRAAVKTGTKLANASKQIPKPESIYLKVLVSSVQGFDTTESYRLMRGPIYRTFRGLKSKEYVDFLTPRWKFSPRRLSAPALGIIIGSIVGGALTTPMSIIREIASLALLAGLAYIGFSKVIIDYEKAIVLLE